MILTIEIAEQAGHDLEEIFDYSHRIHGIDKAYEYVSSFDILIETLAQHPELGRDRSEIRIGLRSKIKYLHLVFYRILEDKIRIVRIIHTAQDIRCQRF